MGFDDYPKRYSHHGHKTFKTNPNGRDFLIGDLHGCYDELVNLLDLVAFDPETDRLFALGDLIDRGPKSMDCLRMLSEPWFHSVLGNHEQMAMDALLYDERHNFWLENGGNWYWGLNEDEIDELKSLIETYVSKLPISITIQYEQCSVGLVHAQPPDDWSDIVEGKADYDNTIWGRKRVRGNTKTPVEGVDMVFVGHTALKWLNKLGNVYPIDSGAGYHNGHLTLVMLPNNKPEPFFIQNLNKHIESW